MKLLDISSGKKIKDFASDETGSIRILRNYHKPPSTEKITGFKGLKIADSKTPIKNGGGLRKRWKDRKGLIYEWDYEKGKLEIYSKSGKNQ